MQRLLVYLLSTLTIYGPLSMQHMGQYESEAINRTLDRLRCDGAID